ncbi:MAG: flavin reductase family protein [Anaerovibrio sp.]|uniref:flavin reductase family protein n=1 Tax=Anaerovibrio sp. TaxID=1872532 RepID=UPI0025FF9211|nr:flavin reductase family protein [Anaerovibrio sp.]MCR5176790.1 flavin reductase family protein [Anaerovibrio sp.]
MRKNFGAKPWSYPQPVFIIATYNQDGTPNAMNAAWCGIHSANEVCICMGAKHKTTENIEAKKAFTISMADVEHMVACDYIGLVSGVNEADKFSKAGFTAEKSEFVDAPLIKELPMALECEVVSYNKSTGELIGKIVNVSIDECVLTPEGTVDVKKLAPITFDPVNNKYLKIDGEAIGNAFKDGAKLK